MVLKMARDSKPKISPKLERFLMTIARRRNIDAIVVALVVMFDGSVALCEDRTLPSRLVESSGIDAAVSALMDKLELRGGARYIGYVDKGKVRQYNFAVEPDARPKLGMGFVLTDAAGAAGVLGRKEAKLILGSFGRPPVVRQMLIW
jgi:hypothetical protein